jgi:hypothetical protein
MRMNKVITTSQLPPIAEPKPRESVSLTTNKVQPDRAPDIAKADRAPAVGLITTRNIEQVQAANRKAEEPEEAASKKGGKGK